MNTKRNPLAATLAAILGLLLLTSPAFSQPVQQKIETITLPAIGVGPIQPQQPTPSAPVQVGPGAYNPVGGIGVGPVQPQPVQVGPATPVAIGVGPAQPQATPPPQDFVPVQPGQEYYPPQFIPVQPGQEFYPAPQGTPFPQPAPGVIVQPGGEQQPIRQQPVRVVVKELEKQRVIVGLQNLLNQQAALGQFPHNNAMLSDISLLIEKHSRPPSSKVRVVNSGPGTLKVTHPDGSTTDVGANFSLEITVADSKVGLSAQFQNVLISLEHVANGNVKFWDEDDGFHTTLAPGHLGAVQQHHFTLTPGVWQHHLIR